MTTWQNEISFHLPGVPLGGEKAVRHNAVKAKIISCRSPDIFPPPPLSLSSACGQHQEKKNSLADLYLVVRWVCIAAALVLMYNLANVFSPTVSATLLYIPLTEPRDKPPHPSPSPQLLAVLTSRSLIRMLAWRWDCESRLAPADEWTEMAWMK